MTDEPLCKVPPKVAACEALAIRLYREKYPDAPLWQELAHSTRTMWVVVAEQCMKAGASTLAEWRAEPAASGAADDGATTVNEVARQGARHDPH